MHRVISVQTRSYPTLVPPPPSAGAPWGIFFHPGYRADLGTPISELWVMPITGGVVGDPELFWTAPTGAIITALFYSTLSGRALVYVCTSSGGVYAFAEGESPQIVGGYDVGVSPNHAAEFGGMLYLSFGSFGVGYRPFVQRMDPRTGLCSRVYGTTAYNRGSGGLAVSGGTLYWSDGASVYASSDGTSWATVYSEEPIPAYSYLGVDASPRSLGGLVSDQATGVVYVGGKLDIYFLYPGVGRVVTQVPAIWSLSGGALAECWRGLPSLEGGDTGAINSLRYLDNSLDSGASRAGPYGHNDLTNVAGESPLIVATPGGPAGWIPTGLGRLSAPNQGMASYGGRLYAILYTGASSGYYESTLAAFDGAAWSAVRRFPYSRPELSGCICVPNTGYLCHEV